MFYNYDSNVLKKNAILLFVNILIFVILPLFCNSLIIRSWLIEFKIAKYQVTITVKDNKEEQTYFKAGRC